MPNPGGRNARALPTEIRGLRARLPDESGLVVINASVATSLGVDLFVTDAATGQALRQVSLTAAEFESLDVVTEDGAGPPGAVLAGLWTEWMLDVVRAAGSTALVSSSLRPYPHQMDAVYGRMLDQPLLRFLLADEPGTGKTMMSGLWLREAQRLGRVKRALVVCPAHLVHKWQADFERYLGGGLQEVTAESVRWHDLAESEHDTWVVSMHLAAANPQVREALHPDRAGWDAIIFDEAHRMTPTARTLRRVGMELSPAVPNALFLTATPHRGDEWFFRELLHLVDPDVFPASDEDAARRRLSDGGERLRRMLRPGSIHFLRRMKEELVDYDSRSKLFNEREASNVKAHLNSTEQDFYERAQEIANSYFPQRGRQLAAMVYGKRAASSMYALAQTLRRRSEKMDSSDGPLRSAGDLVDSGVLDDATENEVSEDEIVSAHSTDAKAEKAAIAGILAELEPMVESAADAVAGRGLRVSKWPRMVEKLNEQNITPGAGEQLVVFTEFTDTANWLVEMFEAAGFSSRRYSGDDGHPQRDEIRRRFENGDFEVIVSTDAGNEGIDLHTAHVLVNWDMPWSLVRLEQRMGRIHRIGQHDKVYLYNMVALGTREGDAHERLLDRLIEAANELGGQMFDSLGAIMERAGARHVGGSLLPFFEQRGTRHSDMWPTVDEMRQARDEYLAEAKKLTTEVDTDAANAARIDDAIARVNPVVAEAFLGRLAAAAIVDVGKTIDDGFFLLSTNETEHGWRLPHELAVGDAGPALVVTRRDARDAAVADGLGRAADALMLGPSDPAFRALAEGVRKRLGAEMWQGAVLHDPTVAHDYTLFVYESDITEGTEIRNHRHRPRHSTHSWLIQVDAAGQAQCVSWGILPNLMAPAEATPEALDTAVAEAARLQALDAAESECERRSERLDQWVSRLRAQLSRLPNGLTDGIRDSNERTAERQRIESTIRERIDAAKAVAHVTVSEPRLVGWARVVAVAEADPAAEDDLNADSEEVSMRWVTDSLTSQGWQVRDVHSDGHGYDLEARRGPELRCVEVKGRAGKASASGIMLTGGEILSASQLRDNYWLYVVEGCVDGTGHLFGKWRNPAEAFADSLVDVSVFRLPGSALVAALDKQEDLQ